MATELIHSIKVSPGKDHKSLTPVSQSKDSCHAMVPKSNENCEETV